MRLTIEQVRNDTATALIPQVQEGLEQFLTPISVARQAVKSLYRYKNPISILVLVQEQVFLVDALIRVRQLCHRF